MTRPSDTHRLNVNITVPVRQALEQLTAAHALTATEVISRSILLMNLLDSSDSEVILRAKDGSEQRILLLL